MKNMTFPRPALLAALVAATCCSSAYAGKTVSWEDLLNDDKTPQDVLSYGLGLKAQRHSTLAKVNTRNVANLVPPYDTTRHYDGAGAAIEYAVRDLKVDHIIVLGHAHCGGIKAMLGAAGGQWPDRDFIGGWVSMVLDASRLYLSEKDEHGQPLQASLQRLRENAHLVERAAIAGSLKNLLSYPWVRERVEAGTLVLHGWWFDLDTGDLWATEPGGMQLMPVL